MSLRAFSEAFAGFLTDNAHDIAEETLEWLEANYGDGDERFEPEDIIDEIADAVAERFLDLPFVDEKALFTSIIAPIVYTFCDIANPIMDDEGEDEEE